ncbi:DUF5979 domain-containing protein [Corynebacterium pseudotuberculosis]|uniref:DUF5979 domain-containing protein n=1 Tax=Corynebacterium pseudotuberculosis (strain C231) TaxID=681645 RepID=D9QD76_CORP2|nr:DUF5979 domain-containing protein [Corynebacterium pseudotuberculosis]ADK27815.1 hypothetical protein CPFRC_00120 [Corynebacterium pseudotuberculosis FRC41]ADL09520.1 hypothetical protein CPC231_00120 [Corynebacterium pseudotuberculosis C231]ADL19931.2 hypothetical protein CP1002_00120 [Corynebacterium pseudotuberculosis 1002]ADO25319.3 hypothetical protein CPI19_00120 [Corynebacterium pseudotuberculosis I19]AEK91368.1 Hypothetical protein CpPAT10_0023 [Corynebacterium pseudotuberculosis PA
MAERSVVALRSLAPVARGRGSKGGFTIEKIVSGERTSKQFSFAWSCTSQGKEMKNGTIKLTNGDVHHEKQLDKDASCVIKEEDADAASEKKHSLKWSVDSEEKRRGVRNHIHQAA